MVICQIYFLHLTTIFGHENTFLKFKLGDGITPLRPFSNLDEMHEHIIEKHNSVVKPQDKTYFVGDVAMNFKKWKHLLHRMNGEKVLIKGNHDIDELKHYAEFFKDVRGLHQFSGVLITHIPVHPESLARWGVNIHGHLHHNRVKLATGALDKRYFNVSMECIDYTPISLEEIKKIAGVV